MVSIKSDKAVFEVIEALRHLSKADVAEMIRSQGEIPLIRLGDLTSGAVPLCCIDGRSGDPVVGIAAGDMGAIIVALAAIEDIRDGHLPTWKVNKFFEWYLEEFGSMYMHTDEHALESLLDLFRKEEKFVSENLNSVGELEGLIRNPPEDLRDDLLGFLLDPEFIGCGHLKLILQKYKLYGIRKGLVLDAIRAFFWTMWTGTTEQKKKLTYIVLSDQHDEGAVVSVEISDDELNEDTLLPAISPKVNGLQMFVVHRQAEVHMRLVIARKIVQAKRLDVVESSEGDLFIQTMDKIGSHITGLTVAHLAGGLRPLTVKFPSLS